MSNPAAKPSRAAIAALAACVGAALVLFQFFGNATRGYVNTASMFWWWVSQWLDARTESEHAWLILGISGWLFWRNLRNAEGRVPNARWEDGNSGFGIRHPAWFAMVAGLALHAIGFIAQQTRISIVGFLVLLWGVVRLAGGPRWGRAAFFPIGFMLFAIPISVLDTAGFWLRMWVINASAGIAHLAGIEVLRSGTQLVAPDGRYNYDVAAACSGVRSLTAMVALSLLMGYLNFRSGARRAFVLLLCFPLVYLGNVARITSIIFAAQVGGPKWGDVAHDVMGYGIFVIVLGGVLGAVSAMQKWFPERAEATDNRPQTTDYNPAILAVDKTAKAGNPRSVVCSLWFGVSIIAALAVGEMFLLHHISSNPDRGAAGVVLAAGGADPVELPAFIGTEWIGRRTPVTAVEREILPVDTGFSRKVYVSLADANRTVLLSIVLSGRDRTSIHRPELCLVGQGWTIAGASTHAFTGPKGAGAFDATVLDIRRQVPSPKGGSREIPQVAAYYFIDSEKIVASHWQRFMADAWNRVVHGRADRWAYVILQTDARDGRAAALARIQQVLDGTLSGFVGAGVLTRPKR